MNKERDLLKARAERAEAELAKANGILHLDGLSLRQAIARAERAEAELAKANGILHLDGLSLRQAIARAERAETNFHEQALEAMRIDLLRQKAEARVAELERMEEHWHNRAIELERLSDKLAQAIMLHDPIGEAREREAE